MSTYMLPYFSAMLIINLASEVFGSPNRNVFLYMSFMWLLVVTLINSYSEKSKLSKESYIMYNLKRKILPGSGMELNPEFKR